MAAVESAMAAVVVEVEVSSECQIELGLREKTTFESPFTWIDTTCQTEFGFF